MARNNIDLQGLIDTLLERIKNQGSSNWYGGNNDEAEYWKAMRARNTALEVGKQNISGELARQGLVNTGNLDVANAHAGAQRYGYDMGLKGTDLSSGRALEGVKYTADAGKEKSLGGTPEEQFELNKRALLRSSALKDKTPEEISQILNMNYTSAPSGKDKGDFYKGDSAQPVAATPSVTPQPTITSPVVNPARASLSNPATGNSSGLSTPPALAQWGKDFNSIKSALSTGTVGAVNGTDEEQKQKRRKLMSGWL